MCHLYRRLREYAQNSLSISTECIVIVQFELMNPDEDMVSFSNARLCKIETTFFGDNIFSFGQKIHHSYALARYACDFEVDRSKTGFLRSKKPEGEHLILEHSLLLCNRPSSIEQAVTSVSSKGIPRRKSPLKSPGFICGRCHICGGRPVK